MTAEPLVRGPFCGGDPGAFLHLFLGGGGGGKGQSLIDEAAHFESVALCTVLRTVFHGFGHSSALFMALTPCARRLFPVTCSFTPWRPPQLTARDEATALQWDTRVFRALPQAPNKRRG